MKRIPLGIRYLVLGIALLAALLVGAGAFSSSPSSPQQRAAALDAKLKCPSCQDLSVAQSNSPASVAIRTEVRHRIDEGQSDAQVVDALRARYGDAVLLTPPAGGLSVLLWLVPLLLVIAITLVVVFELVKRKRTTRP